MFKRYPQLQSGYLIASEEMIIKPESPPLTPSAALLNRQPTRTQQDLFYVPEVDRMVDAIIQRPLVLRDFKVQEEFLGIISKTFSKQSFSSFINLQAQNPGLSQVHIEFLKETVELVTSKRDNRSVSLQTWGSLISAANASAGGFNSSKFHAEFKDTGYAHMPLHDFITAWIRKGGWNDLIISMQVIFGRRTLHAIRGGTY